MNTSSSPLRHIVAFKFNDQATEEQIAEVIAAFARLPEEIPGITAFEHGVNNSPEGKSRGFTHIFQLTFESATARDGYLPHPAHAGFGGLLDGLGVLEDAFVLDYHPES